MIPALIVVGIFILIALLRFGVAAEYSGDGVTVVARAGPVKIQVLPPKKKKPKKVKKDKPKKVKKPVEEVPEEVKRPGKLKDFLKLLPAVKTALGRLRRRMLIKRLTIHYTSAGDDPSNTAMVYGAANAAFSVVVPMLEKAFRIRRRDVRAFVDFTVEEPFIYLKIDISIAVWELIYISWAIIKGIAPIIKRRKVKLPDEKDMNTERNGHENGEAPVK